ncbi:MAG: dihydrolipoyllysine-residue acetyltransferase [Gammaproteobacteria bacterium]
MTLSIKNITTPDLGGATDVAVIEVLVKPGDTVAVDQTVVTLESDKATLEIPSSDAGVVKEVKVKVNDKVSTGSVLIVLEAKAAPAEKTKEATPAKAEPAPVAQKAEPVAAPVEEITDEDDEKGDVHAGPGVRRLARELGVSLNVLSGTGPKQRILKEDVQSYVKGQLAAGSATSSGFSLPSAPSVDFSKFGDVEKQALSRIKKISGKNLQRNWTTIPHVTQFADVDITALEEFRQSQKNALDKQKVKLTPLVFIMKAVVAALKAFPNVNASLDATGENLILKQYFHIGVAVDTPDGLVVPVIRDVDKKGLIDLAKELAVISEKARNKQLSPGDMQGGCFSISSLGGIGGTAFTPIINAPEVAILGVSKSSYQPVYQDGVFVPRLMLPLSLSYDHRVIDGAEGARFIMFLSSMLSDIRNLLM